jgi:hypothetical protein
MTTMTVQPSDGPFHQPPGRWRGGVRAGPTGQPRRIRLEMMMVMLMIIIMIMMMMIMTTTTIRSSDGLSVTSG